MFFFFSKRNLLTVVLRQLDSNRTLFQLQIAVKMCKCYELQLLRNVFPRTVSDVSSVFSSQLLVKFDNFWLPSFMIFRNLNKKSQNIKNRLSIQCDSAKFSAVGGSLKCTIACSSTASCPSKYQLLGFGTTVVE